MSLRSGKTKANPFMSFGNKGNYITSVSQSSHPLLNLGQPLLARGPSSSYAYTTTQVTFRQQPAISSALQINASAKTYNLVSFEQILADSQQKETLRQDTVLLMPMPSLEEWERIRTAYDLNPLIRLELLPSYETCHTNAFVNPRHNKTVLGRGYREPYEA